MTKVIPIEIVRSMSGKICSHSDMSFRTNKKTGSIHTQKRCYETETEPTEKQVNHRKAFGSKVKMAAAWIKANKGNEEYEKVKAAYDAQRSVGSLMGFVMKHLNSDGTIDTKAKIMTYAITATPNDSGRGSVSGGGEYAEGTSVTLQAVAESGYEFKSWQDGNTDNPRTVVVTGNMGYVATFESSEEQNEL